MNLPAHHPFSLEYTADPRPTFARAHAGEEFIAVLPRCSPEDAMQRAEGLRRAIEQLEPRVEGLPIELHCGSYTELPLILGRLGHQGGVDGTVDDARLHSVRACRRRQEPPPVPRRSGRLLLPARVKAVSI